ncbi:MAG: hypothetical protein R3C59_07380 [Planctomycetaceae bacterium]
MSINALNHRLIHADRGDRSAKPFTLTAGREIKVGCRCQRRMKKPALWNAGWKILMFLSRRRLAASQESCLRRNEQQ